MRKLISGILIFCMIFAMSMTSMAATAASSGGSELEAAIMSVKSVVTIPEDYTSFTQSSYESEVGGVKTTVWSLNWSDPQGKGYVSASVDEHGCIINFNQYSYRDSTPGISSYTFSEGQRIAEEFLKKVMPEYADDMVESSGPYVAPNYPSDTFNYYFKLIKNGLPVDFITANIAVDKYSEQVSYFYRNELADIDYKYNDASDLIDEQEAAKAFIQNIGLDVEYFSYYDDKARKMNIFAGYVLNQDSGKAIDAKTGEPVILYSSGYGNYYRDAGGAMALESTADSEKSINLTPQEQEAVNVISSLISKQEAEKIARECLGFDSSAAVGSVSLYNDYYFKNDYSWNVYFKDSGSVSVDAKTGEVLSFYTYQDVGTGSLSLTLEEAQKKAEEFLKKTCPEKFAQTKFNENTYYEIMPLSDREGLKTYNFYYTRQVNGCNFSSNSLNVDVDKTTGKVFGYSQNWYDDVTFPSVNGAIPKEDAFNIFDDMLDYTVSYKLTGEKTASAVYCFAYSDSVILKPETGERINWRGEKYQPEIPKTYEDIDGHWAQQIILSLVENGYYLHNSDANFNPDKKITQLDFFMYLYSPVASYYDVDDFYDMLISNKVITEDEKNPKGEVSRQDAAKYVARMMGFDKIASMPELFVYPFNDSVSDSYKGYITITGGLKIMNGDSKGNFNGSRTLTNAETAAVVYNYLSVR